MKKIFSGKLWTLPTSVLLVAGGIVFACAGGDWDQEYGVSNFSPELIADSSYSPFYYSNNFYYKINYEENQDGRFNTNNSNEWESYLNNTSIKLELDFLLQNATAAAIDSAVSYYSGSNGEMLPRAMNGFVMLKKRGDKKITAFLHYLQYALKAQSFATNGVKYSWDYEKKDRKASSLDVSKFNFDLQREITETKDPFLRSRYWFQLVRSAFFNNSPGEVISLFYKYEKGMVHNTIYFRSLGYLAGACYKMKAYSDANYLYSRVYDSCNEMKTAAHYSFHPQEEKDWNTTLALCNNKNEAVTLWQMLGVYYKDEKRAINEIYLLNPKSEKLDLLLARAINKYEQGFIQSYSSPVTDTLYNRLLSALIMKIADAGNTTKPWIWQLAAGYINTLDKHYPLATAYYKSAENNMPKTRPAVAQLRLLKMINTLDAANKIDKNIENRILTDLEWLNHFNSKDTMNLRYADALSWLKKTVAEKYKKQKDWLKAECFTSTTAFYSSTSNVAALKAFLSKDNKTPYERLCANLSAKKLEDINEYQAVLFTYNDKLDSALEKVKLSGANATVELLGNPFNGKIQDCHDCDHAAVQKLKYTRIALLQKMMELKAKITAGEDIYNNALLLGNAHYNITHYGNARLYYEGKILGESHSSPFSIDSVFLPLLTNMKTTAGYYNLALKYALTDEQKARCAYLMAKCERNQWYNKYIYSNNESRYAENEMVDLNFLQGFKTLKQYQNTQYYKDVIRECGYFRSYSSRQ